MMYVHNPPPSMSNVAHPSTAAIVNVILKYLFTFEYDVGAVLTRAYDCAVKAVPYWSSHVRQPP